MTSEFVTPAKARHPRESEGPRTTIERVAAGSQVSSASWKSRRSVFHPLTVTPATMDAMPTSSAMGPSLRRDDDDADGGMTTTPTAG
jgi:hypothetical protein